MTNHSAFRNPHSPLRTPHSAMERSLVALNAVAAAVSQSLRLDEVVSAALDAVLEATGFEVGGVALWDEEKQRLQPMATRGVEPELLEAFLGPPRAGGNRERLLRHGQPVFHDDTAHDPTVNPEIARLGFTISGMVPLVHAGKVLGILAVATRAPRQWTAEDKSLLTAVGQQIGVAVVNARLYEEIQRSEARYRAVVEAQTELIHRFRPDGTITFVNEAYCRYFDKKPEELIGHSFVSWMTDEERAKFAALVSSLSPQNPVMTLEHLSALRSGERRWLHWTIRGMFDHRGHLVECQAVGRDITERKQAEEALRQASKEWQDIFQAIGHLALILDPQRNVIAANRATVEATGETEEELRGRKCYEVFHGTDRPPKGCPFEKMLMSGRPEVSEAEMKALGRVFLVSCTPVLDEASRLEKVIHIATDITERRRTEEALRESEERFRTVAEGALAGVYIIQDGKFRYVNPALGKVFGYTPDEIVDKLGPLDLTHPDDHPLIAENIRRRITGQMESAHYTFRGVRKDGSVIYCEVLGRRSEYQGRPAIIGTLMDVTERVRAEEALRLRMEQLTALSQAAQAVTASLEPDQVLAEIISLASKVASSDYTSVVLMDEEGRMGRSAENVPGVPAIEYRIRDGGFTNWIVRTHRAVVVDEIAEDGAVSPIPGEGAPRIANPHIMEAGVKSFVGLPLLAKGRLLGVLYLHSLRPRAFRDQLPVLTTFANQAAIAIENARLFQAVQQELAERQRAEKALQRRLNELTILQAIATAGTEATDEDTLIERATQIIGETLHLDNFGVILLDEANGTLRPHPSHRLRAGGRAFTLRLGEGIVGQVALTGQPRRVPDVRLDPDYMQGDPQTRSELCVPLKVGERVIGVINTESTELDGYSEDDERLLSAVASQLATAIEKLRLLEQTEQRALEMTSLYIISLRLATAGELDELLQTIVEQAAALLQARGGGLYLYDQTADELELAVVHGIVLEEDKGTRLQPGEGLSGKVMQKRRPLVVDDYRTWEGRSPKYEGRPYTAVAAVPLLWRNQLIGVLEVTDDKERRTFDENDVRLLSLLAQQAAAAIANARLFGETRQLKEFNESIVQSMTEGILVEDADGVCTFVNPTAAEMLGYAPEELVGQHWTTIVPPDQRPIVRAANERRKRGQADRYEVELACKDGRRLAVLVSGSPRFEDGRFAGTLAVFTDISERKQMEEEIRRRAAHLEALNAIIATASRADNLHTLLESALEHTLKALGLEMGGIWTTDFHVLRGLPPAFGQAKAEITRTAKVDLTGAVVIDDWRTVAVEPFSTFKPLLDRYTIRSSITVPILAEGRRIGGMSVAAPQPRSWSAEEVALVEAVGHQLGAAAERLRLLEQTRAQAQQMQEIMNTVPEGVLVLDARRRIVIANPVAREYLRLLAGAEVGDHLLYLGGRPIEELLKPPPEGLFHELVLEGPPRRIFEAVAQAMGPEAEGWVVILRDVTQERAVQQRIQLQERLAVVGQLAAGIAHDFNNIMASIVLYAQMLLRKPDLAPKERERLTTIYDQARRAADLVQQILDFSRASILERQPLDLVPFLKEMLKLWERTLPENISLHLTYGRDDYVVHADPTRIQQVFMNLAVNARDAMPEGGELRLGLSRVHIEPGERPPLPEMEPGDWVQVTVSDTGIGIPPEVMPHIFEPFFTTKAPGEGSGLGLAQVYGIVKQHEGHIDAKSRVGEGTTFTIYLPALSLAGPEREQPEMMVVAQGSGETILVVEDDLTTREALRETLEALNYRVLVAADGQEALAVCERHGDEIALVLSDWVMPEMGARELSQALKRARPGLRMVVLTGYPLGKQAEELRALDIVDWVQKPIDLDQLAEVMRRALRAT